jgi:hypothetical protein
MNIRDRDLHHVRKLLGLPPQKLMSGLLARARASNDRHAARVARVILGKTKAHVFTGVMKLLGLSGRERAPS